MTEQTKGILWLIGGVALLLLEVGLILECAVIGLGLWMIDRGMRLHGMVPLFEKIRHYTASFFK